MHETFLFPWLDLWRTSGILVFSAVHVIADVPECNLKIIVLLLSVCLVSIHLSSVLNNFYHVARFIVVVIFYKYWFVHRKLYIMNGSVKLLTLLKSQYVFSIQEDKSLRFMSFAIRNISTKLLVALKENLIWVFISLTLCMLQISFIVEMISYSFSSSTCDCDSYDACSCIDFCQSSFLEALVREY